MLKSRGVSPQTTVIITNGTPYQYQYVTPDIIPSTEPTDGQVKYTPVSAQLPLLSSPKASCSYIPYTFVWGKNTSGSSQTLSYALYKNNNAVTTGTLTVANGSYWTVRGALDVVTDPLINEMEMCVWCTTGNLEIWGYTVSVHPTRVKLESNKILYDVNFSIAARDDPTTGLSNVARPSNWCAYFPFDVIKHTSIGSLAVAFSKYAMNSEPHSFILDRLDNSGQNACSKSASTVYYPDGECPGFPHTLSYRILRVEKSL